MNANKRAVELAEALADPLRLKVLQHLTRGAATVSELMHVAHAAQSKVSNHLGLLRQRRMVRAARHGRQMVYELHDPAIGRLVESLTAIAGPRLRAPRMQTKASPLVLARTCYDHLGGRAGVKVFRALVAKGALKAGPSGRGDGRVQPAIGKSDRVNRPAARSGEIRVGPRAREVFARLGIKLETHSGQRRRFASACPDWTERRPHLGGTLGGAVLAKLFEKGWAARQPGTRAVTITEAGRRGLLRTLGVQLVEASP